MHPLRVGSADRGQHRRDPVGAAADGQRHTVDGGRDGQPGVGHDPRDLIGRERLQVVGPADRLLTLGGVLLVFPFLDRLQLLDQLPQLLDLRLATFEVRQLPSRSL